MEQVEQPNKVEYAGFWVRVGASLIDTILILFIILPVLTMVYGSAYWEVDVLAETSPDFVIGYWDFILNYMFPAIAVIVFWVYKSATPGKMLFKITIVDAKTGGKPTTGQFVIRYLGYYASAIPLLIGIIWVAFDDKKQGWHDKIAGTVAIRSQSVNAVKFET